ncbi:MAG: prepilin-type N-terminal cleavage/methylation domain-containing protein, partial [Planctomycetes bacterium]|nr:prepilin-type N-terminal cleavage/methylation domain-containing protein [Planctomycetota bacterium]
MKRSESRQTGLADPARDGLTLVEMLIAMVLMATLLAGVWSLSHIFTRLFASGTQVVIEAQLVRSLLAQINSDLQAVVPISLEDRPSGSRTAALSTNSPPTVPGVVPPIMSGQAVSTDGSGSTASIGVTVEFLTSSSLPHFGLVGTEKALYVSVLQAAAPSVAEQLASEEEAAFGGETLAEPSFVSAATDGAASNSDLEAERLDEEPRRPAYAPELRIVAYSFRDPTDTTAGGLPLPAGLIRREVPWEFAANLLQAATAAPETPSLAADFNDVSIVGQATDVEMTADLTDELEDLDPEQTFGGKGTTIVPEVVGVQFRYFDGQSWKTSWNSLQTGTLPVAVEVTLQVLTAEELKKLRELTGEPTEEDQMGALPPIESPQIS